MDRVRLAAVAHHFSKTRTRRGAFAGALLALAIPSLALPDGEIQAKKKGKNKKPCRPKPTPKPACQEACSEICDSCFTRRADSIICGSGFEAGLVPRSSDNDCVAAKIGDIHFPYCLTQVESRVSGQVDNIRGGTGICTNVFACGAV